MVGVVILILAVLISGRATKCSQRDELEADKCSQRDELKADDGLFILFVFSVIFVVFSPIIATMTVSETNIFSVTKQYNETYHIVGLQDGTYYKVEKEKFPQRYLQENGWHVTINQCDDTTNTYAAMEYDTKNVWYGTAEDRPYVELSYAEKEYNVPLWYKITFFVMTPDSEKTLDKITIYTPEEK